MLSAVETVTIVVLPLRRGAGGSIELLVLEPLQERLFRDGNLAFPCGPLLEEDWSERRLRRCRGLDPSEARKILGSELKPGMALGHWVGAIRVLYEATGILLWRNGSTDPSAPTGSGKDAAGRAKRVATRRDSTGLGALLESEGRFCDLSRVSYFSRWIQEGCGNHPVRYFLARLPSAEENAPVDLPGRTNAAWLSPEAVLRCLEESSASQEFSAFANLRALADYETWEGLWSEYGPVNDPAPL